MQNTYRPWHLATFRTSKHIYGYVFFECHEHTVQQSTVFFECHVHVHTLQQSTVLFERHLHTVQQSTVFFDGHVHTVQKTINCILWVSRTYTTTINSSVPDCTALRCKFWYKLYYKVQSCKPQHSPTRRASWTTTLPTRRGSCFVFISHRYT